MHLSTAIALPSSDRLGKTLSAQVDPARGPRHRSCRRGNGSRMKRNTLHLFKGSICRGQHWASSYGLARGLDFTLPIPPQIESVYQRTAGWSPRWPILVTFLFPFRSFYGLFFRKALSFFLSTNKVAVHPSNAMRQTRCDHHELDSAFSLFLFSLISFLMDTITILRMPHDETLTNLKVIPARRSKNDTTRTGWTIRDTARKKKPLPTHGQSFHPFLLFWGVFLDHCFLGSLDNFSFP